MSELLGSKPPITRMPGETDEEFEARKRKAQSGPKVRYLTDEEIRNLPPSFAEQQIAEMNFSPAQIDSMAQDPKSIDQGGYYDQVIAHKRREREKQDAEHERLYGSDKEKDPVQVALENTSIKTDEAPSEEGSVGNVLSRSNNPTGIRLPAEKAKRYYSPDNEAWAYGESTVVGNTPGGFVHFGDRYSGGAASIHDAQAKAKRDLTLEQFIEEQSKGDSTGIANHKINIPAILKKDGIDVSLDMLVSDIPFLPFMNALTQSEGGVEHRKIYEPIYAQILDQNESKTNNFLQLDREQGQGDKIRELEMFPKRPPTNDEATAITDTASVNDPLVRNLTEEPPTGEQFTPLSSEELAKMTPEERNAYNNRAMDAWSKSSKSFSDLTGDKSTDQTDPITERLTADSYLDDPNVSIPDSVRNRVDPIRMTERISQDRKLRQQIAGKVATDPVDETANPVDAKPDRRPKLSMDTTDDVTFADGQPQLRVKPATAGISDINDVFVSPEQKQKIEESKGFIQPSAEDALRFERTEGFVLPESTETEDTSVSIDDSAQAPTKAPTEDPTVNNSIFARLGRAIKDNPEIALSGAESLGSLLASIGQSRGQRKEDARVREATGRANLISALTGGRVRPQVTSETPELGLLGRIGQGLKVGGSTVRDAMEKQAAFGLKEGELQRKIEKDASTAARYISQNNLDEAKAQNYIDRISIGRSAEERKMLEAQIKAYLGIKKEERLSATDKWKQALANKQTDIKQAYLELKREDQIEAHKQAVEALGIDTQRANAYTTRANAYAKSIEKKAEKDAKIDEKTARDDFRKTVSDVRKEVGFLDSERGTLNVYRGLESAYANWETTGFNAAAATAVFNFYQQLFDPATVREGDLNMQKEAQGYLQSLAALKQRSVGEGFVLSKEQIRRMKSLADQFFKSAQAASAGQINTYLDVLYEDDAEELNKYHRYYNSLFGPKGENEPWFGVGQPTVNEVGNKKDKDKEKRLDAINKSIGNKDEG